MKKNKFYLILVLLISIIFFATSALCNQCTADTEDKIGTKEEEASESEEVAEEEPVEEVETPEEETEEEGSKQEETPEEEEIDEEEEETQSAFEEPTIRLEIYEGPLYSSSDDVCYWRVKAIVTGVPTPTVEFNRDDSNGAWGSKKAQVNLANPTDSYSLQATATNTEGTAIDSIVLVWECNRPPEISDIVMMGDHFAGIEYEINASASDPDGDALIYSWSVNGGTLDSTTGSIVKWTMPGTVGNYQVTVEADDGNGGNDQRTETIAVTDPVLSMNVPIAPGEGGWMLSTGDFGLSDWSYTIGDSVFNNTYKGFISFDITGLAGSTIESAALTFELSVANGDPSSFVPVWVSSAYWGSEPIESGDYNITNDPIKNFSTSNFTCYDSKLKTYLQNAITDGNERFQIIIFFTGKATDNDNTIDIWTYNKNTVDLDVTYTP